RTGHRRRSQDAGPDPPALPQGARKPDRGRSAQGSDQFPAGSDREGSRRRLTLAGGAAPEIRRLNMPSHQDSRARMVERQLRARGIGDLAVLRAMGEVPREAFVPENLQEFAYEDGPLPIGSEQTISQPFIVALMAEQADIPPRGRVLEIGTGSGYGAAVLSRLAAEVFSIE